MSKQVLGPYGDELLTRNGLTREVAVWEDGLRTQTGAGYFEWWYFDAHLGDGSTAVVVFTTKMLQNRMKGLTPTVQLTITTPAGQKLTQSPVYRPDQFLAERDRCDVRMGPSWVRGDLARYELHAEAPGLTADLTFTRGAPSWRPGCGKTYYDDNLDSYFGWFSAIPYGTVDGTLTYDGVAHAVRGTGYHDHNWGNVGLEKVLSYWYWGRAHVGDYSLIFADIVCTKAYGAHRSPVFMVAKGDTVLSGEGGTLQLDASQEEPYPKGRPYPQVLNFSWAGQTGTARVALREPTIIEAFSPLAQLPLWERVLAGLFVKPYYFRFNSRMDFSLDMAGQRTTESGTALWELMFLR